MEEVVTKYLETYYDIGVSDESYYCVTEYGEEIYGFILSYILKNIFNITEDEAKLIVDKWASVSLETYWSLKPMYSHSED